MFGHPLHSQRLAMAHLFLANFGLVGLVAGFLVQPHASVPGRWVAGLGGIVFGLGAVLWVWNLWHTLPHFVYHDCNGNDP